MKRIGNLDLNKKIFFTTLAVILLISAIIAFLARWILISSLTDELYSRGISIAQSIADRARGHILDNDTPQLVTLVFDNSTVGERRDLVTYIFITDNSDSTLAHTFIRPFPEELREASLFASRQKESIRKVKFQGNYAYDIAVPVKEGIYQIGTVHLGLSKQHIDNLVGKLRVTFLGFISAIIVTFFFISLRLANYITLPLSKLTRISDELSKGNFDIRFNTEDDKSWNPQDCPAYRNTDLPCWHFDQTADTEAKTGHPEALRSCRKCNFYEKNCGDEVKQLANSFRNMVWSIKLYRKRLQESEMKYRSLFDSGPDPILVVEQNSLKILDANPRAEELYGYCKEELSALQFSDLYPEYRTQCLSHFDEMAAHESCVYLTKILHYRKDQKPIYVNMHACPISYKGKQATIIASTDITEMIEKDAQLIQASKMKTLGEMSAGIAHELNQPLNAIKMGSDFLTLAAERNSGLQAEQLIQVAKEISAQVDRASEIINTLRAFGRKAEMTQEKLDINKSINGVLNIIGQQFRLSNIVIDLDLADDLPPIHAHDNRIQQVIFNLMTNARDAIQHNPEPSETDNSITIRSFLENKDVCMEVTDTGCGITPEQTDKIFEPFFTTKETGQGMGLGLSISYGIVKDYDGDISIRSELSQGTTFRLTFPAAEPKERRGGIL